MVYTIVNVDMDYFVYFQFDLVVLIVQLLS